MNRSFTGRKLLVVGGTSGMGYETAKAVLERGGSALILGHRLDKTATALTQLQRHGAVTAITADISEPAGVTQVLKAIRTEHREIDLLVNAAGVFFPKPTWITGAIWDVDGGVMTRRERCTPWTSSSNSTAG